MPVNLEKHKDELQKAWEDVHDANSSDNWVIFGYEGKSHDLKVVEKGDGGLEEMMDSLSGGKILYSAVRVEDPNTNLPKIVFVNWQGEGVPSSVKGTCASHWRDITGFFKGAHVTIQARSEDDLNEDTVMDKVKKSSGANYGFHKEKPKPISNPSGPVGTNYKRVNPLAEINVKSRDKFWMEQQKAEKQRIEEEKQRLVEQKQDEEKKRTAREAKEQAAREDFIKERSQYIASQRQVSKQDTDRRRDEEKKKYEEVLKEANRDDEEFRGRSESLRKQRLMEAQHLIRERKKSLGEMNPRSTFQKEGGRREAPPPVQAKTKRGSFSAAPVVNGTQKSKPPPPAPQPKPKRSPSNPSEPTPEATPQAEPEAVVSQTHVPEREPEPVPQKQPELEPEREHQPEKISQPPPEPVAQLPPEPVAQPPSEPVAQPTAEPETKPEAVSQPDNELYEEVPERIPAKKAPARDAYEEVPDHTFPVANQKTQEPEELYESIDDAPQKEATPAVAASASDQGLTARAAYDYQAADETEISFDPGDVITHIEQIDEGWWKGMASNGHVGLFPANYVELLSSNEQISEAESPQTQSQGAGAVYEIVEEPPRDAAPVSAEPVIETAEGLSAKALFDYQAADDSEITFDPGDIITNIEKVDEGWWKGTAPNGNIGLFPANYVEQINPRTEAPQADFGLRAKALYDYQAADESEVTFDPGDIISNIEQVDEGWWRGTVNGSTGLFPANYVELIS